MIYFNIGGAGTSSGPAARAKWEIEYYHFFGLAPCIYLLFFFFFLPSESCSDGGGILIVTASSQELSHNAAVAV